MMSKIIERIRRRDAKTAELRAREEFRRSWLEISGERPD